MTTIPALLIGLGILAITAGLLYWAGRSLICPCGTVKLFDFFPNPAEDSQHIFDWYTFSHILHGLIFYFLIWLVGRGRVPFTVGILIALVLESGWELFENSQYIINRYQSQSISEHYNGDSVINAIGDILTMAAGFFLASLLPVLASVAVLIGIEVWMAWMIRDNLTLNIISLTHPIQSITQWQEGRQIAARAPCDKLEPELYPLCRPGRREAVSRDPIRSPQFHCRNLNEWAPALTAGATGDGMPLISIYGPML